MFHAVNHLLRDRHIRVFVFVWGFVLGILVSSFANISPLTALFILFLAASIFCGEKILHKKVERGIVLMVLCYAAFGIGILRFDIKDFHNPSIYQSSLGTKIELEGTVASELERRDVSARFILKTSTGEKILVTTDMYSPVRYGDVIHVSGTIKEPERIEEDGRSFNYPEYLAKDDIYLTMSFADVDVIMHGQGNPMKAILFSIKNSFIAKIQLILPEPESSLLAGLIVAGKDAMPKSILDVFTRAGLIHIVVLSGSNITIIAEFFRRVFSFLSRRKRAFATLGAILLFVLMTGASSTIVRAAIMAIAAIGGKLLGRNYSAPRALLSAAFLMLVLNPKILVFDPSFKLSFLATLALIYVAPIIEARLTKIPEKFDLRSIIAITFATQIVVFPYLLYSMGNVSIVALLSNILVLPLVPIAMFVGFFATVIAFLHPYIALPFTYVSHLLLSWILGVANVLGTIRYASLNISISLALTWLFYAGIIFTVLKLRSRETL